jgi:hypothetical protein
VRLFLIILLLLQTTALLAQEVLPVDSLQNKAQAKLDSLQQLKNEPAIKQEIDSTVQKNRSKLDSLASSYRNPVDSTREALEQKIDSLKRVQLPHEQYTKSLDSLANHYPEKLNTSISKAEQQGQQAVDDAKTAVSRKVEEVTGISSSEIEQSGIISDPLGEAEIPNSGFSELQKELPKTPELGLEGADLKEVGVPGNEQLKEVKADLTEKSGYGEIAENVTEVKSTANETLGKTKEAVHYNEVEEKLQEVNSYGEKLSAYEKEVANVKEGNFEGIEKKAEEEVVANFEEIGTLQGQADGIKGEMQADVEELAKLQEEAYLKEQLKEKAVELASTEFAEHAAKLQEAQNSLNKYKSKYSALQSLRDAAKQKRSSLKGKGWRERIAPGFSFEFIPGDLLHLDIAPSLGYRFSKRLALHSGYLYRFTFDKPNTAFQWKGPTYGPKVFTTYMVKKGFYGILSYEALRTNVPRQLVFPETRRDWVYNGFAGVGKAYRVSKYLHGNMLFLYNVLYSAKTPYAKPYNIRMGFDFSLKKRKRD